MSTVHKKWLGGSRAVVLFRGTRTLRLAAEVVQKSPTVSNCEQSNDHEETSVQALEIRQGSVRVL
jgi:hypothetical protein